MVNFPGVKHITGNLRNAISINKAYAKFLSKLTGVELKSINILDNEIKAATIIFESSKNLYATSSRILNSLRNLRNFGLKKYQNSIVMKKTMASLSSKLMSGLKNPENYKKLIATTEDIKRRAENDVKDYYIQKSRFWKQTKVELDKLKKLTATINYNVNTLSRLESIGTGQVTATGTTNLQKISQ